MLPTGLFAPGEFYRILGGSVTLERHEQQRSACCSNSENGVARARANFFPKDIAREINAYPQGTVTAIYMTSDGGSTNKTSTKLDQAYELVDLLAEHVEVVMRRGRDAVCAASQFATERLSIQCHTK